MQNSHNSVDGEHLGSSGCFQQTESRKLARHGRACQNLCRRHLSSLPTAFLTGTHRRPLRYKAQETTSAPAHLEVEFRAAIFSSVVMQKKGQALAPPGATKNFHTLEDSVTHTKSSKRLLTFSFLFFWLSDKLLWVSWWANTGKLHFHVTWRETCQRAVNGFRGWRTNEQISARALCWELHIQVFIQYKVR